MNMMWLIRAKRWAQNPPSWKMVVLVIAIIAACAVLFGLEKYGVLPDWMGVDPRRQRILH